MSNEIIKIGQVWGQRKAGGYHVTWEILSDDEDENELFQARKIIIQSGKTLADEIGSVSKSHLISKCKLENTIIGFRSSHFPEIKATRRASNRLQMIED